MTTEIRQAIDLHLRQGKYPKPNTLSEYLIGKGIACSPAEALAHMREYQEQGMLNGNPELVAFLKGKKTTPENLVEREPVKPSFDSRAFSGIPIKQVKPTVKESLTTQSIPTGSAETKPNKTAKEWLDWSIDILALAIAVIVDIVMNVIGWGIIAYDEWTRIAFIASGIVVVLFSLRSWVKAMQYEKGTAGRRMGLALWACFALIAWFLDTSVSVASSHAQSQVVVYDASKDDVLNKLKEQAKNDADYLQALRTKQVEQGEGYKSQVEDAVTQVNKSSEALRSYNPVHSTDASGGTISSSAIFTAIPDAAMSAKLDRFIGLLLYSIFFAALQLVIITSATSAVKKVEV